MPYPDNFIADAFDAVWGDLSPEDLERREAEAAEERFNAAVKAKATATLAELLKEFPSIDPDDVQHQFGEEAVCPLILGEAIKQAQSAEEAA